MNSELAIGGVLDCKQRGWMPVELNDGTTVSLCFSTQLSCEGEFYRVKEGKYRGYSIRIPQNNVVQLKLRNDDISCVFDRARNIIIFPGLGSFTTSPQTAPLAQGEYIIGLPIFEHIQKTKSAYLNESHGGSRFATTWFPLRKVGQPSKDIFLHFGKISEGCVTVDIEHNPCAWTKIFMYLLLGRISQSCLTKLVVVQ